MLPSTHVIISIWLLMRRMILGDLHVGMVKLREYRCIKHGRWWPHQIWFWSSMALYQGFEWCPSKRRARIWVFVICMKTRWEVLERLDYVILATLGLIGPSRKGKWMRCFRERARMRGDLATRLKAQRDAEKGRAGCQARSGRGSKGWNEPPNIIFRARNRHIVVSQNGWCLSYRLVWEPTTRRRAPINHRPPKHSKLIGSLEIHPLLLT
jgi:hypothetical protein